MYESIYNQIKNNRKLAYRLIETRDKVLKEKEIKEYAHLFSHKKNIDYNSILVKVREQIKNEILKSTIEKAGDEDVYILGHNNPDADAIFSSYLLAKILNKLNVKAHFSVLEEN